MWIRGTALTGAGDLRRDLRRQAPKQRTPADGSWVSGVRAQLRARLKEEAQPGHSRNVSGSYVVTVTPHNVCKRLLTKVRANYYLVYPVQPPSPLAVISCLSLM